LVVVAVSSVGGGRLVVVDLTDDGFGPWHPVKTEPRRRSWRTMTASSDVVSFMKASSMVLASFDLDCSGETLDPGLSDRMMAASGIVTPVGIIFGANVG
jgi:hypothetical protein